MNNSIKSIIAAIAICAPASAFAQDAVAVALGASFQPVDTTSTFTITTDGFDVVIPGQAVENGQATANLPIIGGVSIPVTGNVPGQTVTVEGTTGTVITETSEMELVAISVAAASGVNAAASAAANSEGATAANAGATMRRTTPVLASSDATAGGSAYTSQVLVGQQPLIFAPQ